MKKLSQAEKMARAWVAGEPISEEMLERIISLVGNATAARLALDDMRARRAAGQTDVECRSVGSKYIVRGREPSQ